MRWKLFLAAALCVLSIGPASAADWCGYGSHAKSLIECGYSSVTDCESAVGKGGVCFVDPEYALNLRHHGLATGGLKPARPSAEAGAFLENPTPRKCA